MDQIFYHRATRELTNRNPLLSIIRHAPLQPFGFKIENNCLQLKRKAKYDIVYGGMQKIATFSVKRNNQLRFKAYKKTNI